MLSPESESNDDVEMGWTESEYEEARPLRPLQEWAFVKDFESETQTTLQLYKIGESPGKGWFSMGDDNWRKIQEHEGHVLVIYFPTGKPTEKNKPPPQKKNSSYQKHLSCDPKPWLLLFLRDHTTQL